MRIRTCLHSFPSMKLRVFQDEKCITHLLHCSRCQAQATRKQQHLFVFRTLATAPRQNEQNRSTAPKEPTKQQRQMPNKQFHIRRTMRREFLIHLVLFGYSYVFSFCFGCIYMSR